MVYKTSKLSIFCNIKDSISVKQTTNIICRITCPGCFQKYVGKTHQNLVTRLQEDGTKVDQPMYQHIHNFSAFKGHIMLLTPPDTATNSTIVSKESHLHNVVINNIKILDKNHEWGQLQFLEAYYINTLAAEINSRLYFP